MQDSRCRVIRRNKVWKMEGWNWGLVGTSGTDDLGAASSCLGQAAPASAATVKGSGLAWLAGWAAAKVQLSPVDFTGEPLITVGHHMYHHDMIQNQCGASRPFETLDARRGCGSFLVTAVKASCLQYQPISYITLQLT